MDRTEGLVQRRRQPKVEENHDVNDDDRDEEEERVSERLRTQTKAKSKFVLLEIIKKQEFIYTKSVKIPFFVGFL